MKPLISIIVPVYNAEKYLPRCLDSIMNQTFTNFECILIDDGSKDNSLQICITYKNKDNRFKIIHKENNGVSAARNDGIDIAEGQWIGFVDSDDWIENNMYDQLYNDTINKNVDIVICGFCGNNNIKDVILNSEEATCSLFEENGIGGFSVLRLIKRDLLKDTRFNENVSYMEDTLFNYDLYKNNINTYWHSIPLYHYEANPDSVTHKTGLTPQIQSALNMLQDLENKEQRKNVKNAISSTIIKLSLGILLDYGEIDVNNENIPIVRDIIKRRKTMLKINKYFSNKLKLVINICLHSCSFKLYAKLRKVKHII